MNQKSVYIIDASSLIELERLVNKDFFSPLFKSLESLVNSGNLISHEEVLQELLRKDGTEGDIYKWAKDQSTLFLKYEPAQIEKAKEILDRFPNLIKSRSKNNADPFIISLATIQEKQQKLVEIRYVVLTEELSSGNIDKPKIPDVCAFYKIECLNLNDFLKKELEIKIELRNNQTKK